MATFEEDLLRDAEDDRLTVEYIQNYLPFVVSGDGTWSVNDPLHPMLLSFKENGAAEGVNLDFNYPFADGNRTISITLSPGCKSNSYVYTLGRESNGTGK